MFTTRICPICNESFVPKTSSQIYCRKRTTRTCIVCGKEYESMCVDRQRLTCPDIRCRRKAATVAVRSSQKRCRVCGELFHPTSNNQLDCLKVRTNVCKICGKEFTVRCSGKLEQDICSKSCLDKHIEMQKLGTYSKTSRVCKLCGEIFRPKFPSQQYCSNNHFATCEVCGTVFQISPKASNRRTCSDKCEALLKL